MKFIIKNAPGRPRVRASKLVYILLVFILILIAVAGVSAKLYLDSQKNLQAFKSGQNLPNLPSSKEIKDIVGKVGKHYLLPDEEPKLITIANADVLKKTQPFFAKAKNGDKLLVYSQKVILYDPLADKIIDIAQIRPQETLPTISIAEERPASPTAEIQP